jgi:hypothetical protein
METEGCILVGKTRQVDFIGESRKAFDLLFKRLMNATEREKIYQEILERDPRNYVTRKSWLLIILPNWQR